MQKKITQAMSDFVDDIEKDFESTVQTWDTKVKFSKNVKSRSNRVEGKVDTDNKIYGYVSNGTNDHFVAPRRASALRFQPNYKTKTRRGKIPSRAGGASGSFVFSKGHMVKGIKARKFDLQIKEKREKEFSKRMLKELLEVLEDT